MKTITNPIFIANKSVCFVLYGLLCSPIHVHGRKRQQQMQLKPYFCSYFWYFFVVCYPIVHFDIIALNAVPILATEIIFGIVFDRVFGRKRFQLKNCHKRKTETEILSAQRTAWKLMREYWTICYIITRILWEIPISNISMDILQLDM